MSRYLVRIEVPATWTIEVEAEDEEEADIATRELLGDTRSPGHLPEWSVDLEEAEWSMEEVEG